MLSRIAIVVGAVLLVVAVVALTFVIGMRRKSRPVLDAVRRMNRALLNPRQMKSAGTPGAYASIVRHTGRRSGRPYETPVVATPIEGGFVIALPYGRRSDWLRNVLAAGSATIVHEGGEYRVGGPELLAMETAEEWFPEKDRRGHRMFGVDTALRVRSAA